jgi:hypothetical protein
MGTIRQEILTNKEVSELMIVLHQLPVRIADAQNKIAAIEQRQSVDFSVKKAEEELKEVEAIVNFEVRNEINDDGKLKYGNETLRAQALRIALRKSADYMVALTAVTHTKTKQADLVFEYAKAKNDMSYIVNSFKAVLAACGLIQGLCMEDNAETKTVTLKKIAELVSDTK